MMTFAQILDYPIGSQLKLNCSTTAADIYYHGGEEGGRRRTKPMGVQLQAIPYVVEGRVKGTYTSEVDYLILSVEGEAAVIRDNHNGAPIVTGTEIRTKEVYVPINAIRQITFLWAL